MLDLNSNIVVGVQWSEATFLLEFLWNKTPAVTLKSYYPANSGCTPAAAHMNQMVEFPHQLCKGLATNY